MKKVRVFFWLKTAGLLSSLIIMLIGVPGCRSKRHQTKYGPPPTNYDQTITKYGVLINEDDMKPDTTYNPTITKYGVPIDYDVTPIDSTMVKPENNNN